MRLPRHSRWFILAVLVSAITAAIASKLANPPTPKPEIIAQPVAVPAPQASPAPPTLDATSTTILELFNPSDAMLTQQLNETELSQRVERLLVTIFVLTRCDIISETDYADSYRAIVHYAYQTHLAPDVASADARVRSIATSASASYSLIYSRTKCEDPKLRVVAEQLKSWRATYAQ